MKYCKYVDLIHIKTSIVCYPQICRQLNDIVPGTQVMGNCTPCPCLFSGMETFAKKKSQSLSEYSQN